MVRSSTSLKKEAYYHGKGCVDCLGNLASLMPEKQLDLENAVKRRVKITYQTELTPGDKGHHNLLQKTPLLAVGKMEGLHLNPSPNDIMNAE